MHFMPLIILFVAVLLNLVAAIPIQKVPAEEEPAASPLQVELSEAPGNAVVVAKVTNTGTKPLHLYKASQLLDEYPVDKLYVARNGTPAVFHGMRIIRSTTDLTADRFETLMPGETIERMINVTLGYDLSTTGVYSVVAQGFLQTAPSLNSTDGIHLGVKYPYTSNILEIYADGEVAAQTKSEISKLVARSQLQGNCKGKRRYMVRKALANCANIAQQASRAALNQNDGGLFKTFFKDTSEETRQTVSNRLAAVAKECSTGESGGITRFHCSNDDTVKFENDHSDVVKWDPPLHELCHNAGTLAFTVGGGGGHLPDIWTCDQFYTNLHDGPEKCASNDRANAILHEMTHNTAVFSPGTADFGSTYGPENSAKLPFEKAIQHADSYAFFSTFTVLGCGPSDIPISKNSEGSKKYTPVEPKAEGDSSDGSEPTGDRPRRGKPKKGKPKKGQPKKGKPNGGKLKKDKPKGSSGAETNATGAGGSSADDNPTAVNPSAGKPPCGKPTGSGPVSGGVPPVGKGGSSVGNNRSGSDGRTGSDESDKGDQGGGPTSGSDISNGRDGGNFGGGNKNSSPRDNKNTPAGGSGTDTTTGDAASSTRKQGKKTGCDKGKKEGKD